MLKTDSMMPSRPDRLRISITWGLVAFFFGLSALISSVLYAFRPGDDAASLNSNSQIAEELVATVKSQSVERDRLKTTNGQLETRTNELGSKLGLDAIVTEKQDGSKNA